MVFCYKCGHRVPLNKERCPYCGAYVLAEDEIRLVRDELASARRYEIESARRSKRSFLAWLVEKGLEWIAKKLIELAWKVIKRLFFGGL